MRNSISDEPPFYIWQANYNRMCQLSNSASRFLKIDRALRLAQMCRIIVVSVILYIVIVNILLIQTSTAIEIKSQDDQHLDHPAPQQQQQQQRSTERPPAQQDHDTSNLTERHREEPSIAVDSKQLSGGNDSANYPHNNLPITFTQPTLLDDEEDLRSAYLQHYLPNSRIQEETTTIPSIITEGPVTINETAIQQQQQHQFVEAQHKFGQANASDQPAEVMQTSESSSRQQNHQSKRFELRQLQVDKGYEASEESDVNNRHVANSISDYRASNLNQENVISRARLANLLDVIKQLNFADSSSDREAEKNFGKSINLRSNRNNWQHQPIRWSAEDPGLAPLLKTRLLKESTSSRSTRFHLPQHHAGPIGSVMTLQTSPSNSEASVVNYSDIRPVDRNDSKSSNQDSHQRPSTNINKSVLVSPYSADFNLGNQFNKLSTREKSLISKEMTEQSTNNNWLSHILGDGPKIEIISHKSPETKPQPVKGNPTTIKDTQQVDSVSHNSAHDRIKPTRPTQNKQQITLESTKNLKSAKPTTSSVNHQSPKATIVDPGSSSSNSKRGERQAPEKNSANQLETSDNIRGNNNNNNRVKSEANMSNNHAKVSTTKQKVNTNGHQVDSAKLGSIVDTKERTQHHQASQSKTKSVLASDQFDDEPKRDTNYPAHDPYKKSLYYSTEVGGLYPGDMIRPTTIDDLDVGSGIGGSGQLTIGELARQHGVPFRLKSSQSNGGYKASDITNNISYDDHGMPSESDNVEDYVYMPYRSTNQQSLNSIVKSQLMPAATGGSIKLDDDLKRKIAMKAFEIVSNNNQEFSNALMNNIGIGSAGGGGGGAHLPEFGFSKEHSGLIYPSLPKEHIINSSLMKWYTNLLSDTSGVNINNLPKILPLAPPSLPQQQQSTLAPASSNPMAYMLPLAPATAPENAGNYAYPLPQLPQLFDKSVSKKPTASANNRPVNLMLTDTANRWTLTRMPDLIPIPLAATVPGYLIRLPNGKILAAALTNSFSIQGIQSNTPSSVLNSPNYKSLFNQRIKSMIKPNHVDTSQYSKPNQDLLVQNNQLLKPILVPEFQQVAASSNVNNVAVGRPTSFGATAGGSFPRRLLSQLTHGRTSLRGNNNQENSLSASAIPFTTNNRNRKVKQKIFKQQTNSTAPEISISAHELNALPIADPDEPVFSFADESQLADFPSDYQHASASSTPVYHHSNNNFNQQQSNLMHANSDYHLPQFDHQNAFLPNNQFEQATSGYSSSLAAGLRARLNQMLSLKDTSIGDDIIHGTKKRGSQSAPKLFNRLDSLLNWLARRKSTQTSRNRIIRVCLDKLRAIN